MQLRVSAPGSRLTDADVDRIERDLAKIDRRLSRFDEILAELRINERGSKATSFSVVLELEYGRNHLVAKTDGSDLHQTVREAREEILRQINDRSRGGHSSFAKRR